MNNQTKIHWDTVGKIVIIGSVLIFAFFFPFQKYFSALTNKSKIEEKQSSQDMMTALLEKEEPARDYKTNPQIYWRRDGKSYLLYVNGKQIAGTESSWSGDDLLVHDPGTNTTYILNNFKNLKDNQLREGEIQKKD